jgi:hypothetical protein
MTVTKTPAKAASESSAVVKHLDTPRAWPTAAQIFHQAQVLGWQHRKPLVVDKYLLPVLELVSYYFARDVEFERRGYELDKGLLLYGPIGCGKTRLLELISQLDPRFRFRVVDCDDVARAYKIDGDAALATYCRPGRLLLDDIGVDGGPAWNYKNGANPVGDVLRRRYRLGEAALTFGTTNCAADVLEDLYKDRIADRMNEMFNIIEFDENTPSRRQVAPIPLGAEDVDA